MKKYWTNVAWLLSRSSGEAMWSWFITKSCRQKWDPSATSVGKIWKNGDDKSWPSAFFSLKLSWERNSVPFLKASWRAKWYEMSCFATWRHRWRSCKPAGYFRYFSQVSKLSSGEGSRLDNWKEWVHTKHFEHLSSGVYLTVKASSPTISFESTLIAGTAITV